MSGITDLAVLLREMQPVLQPADYVYCVLPDDRIAELATLSPLGFFREDEGLTVILQHDVAVKNDLAHGTVMRCITLTVHSSLEAVGLTAAVSAALTRAGISANVVAAYYHDHVFVPASDAQAALAALADVRPV